jgi:hypothetical protein
VTFVAVRDVGQVVGHGDVRGRALDERPDLRLAWRVDLAEYFETPPDEQLDRGEAAVARR